MAQFSGGGNKQTGPWGRPLDMQPLVAFPNQGVYQQLPPGLAAMGAAVTCGGPTAGSGVGPAASLPMHSQVNPGAYPRATIGPAFGGQQMLQQQQAAAAAVASLQQQQQQQQQGHPGHGLQGTNPHPPPDRVLVEANYNTNMPFKWNASRIQVMPSNQQQQRSSSNGGGVNPTATPNTLAFTSAAMGSLNNQQASGLKAASNQQNKRSPADFHIVDSRSGGRNSHNNSSSILGDARMMNNRVNHSPPIRGNSSRNLNISGGGGSLDKSADHGRDRRGRNEERSRFMDRDNDRGRDKDRGRSPGPSRKRSRSPRRTRSRSRTRSPPRRRPRTTPRYTVFVPKISLHFPQSSIIDLKKRYGTMYVPSDFFASDHSWMDSFPMHQPLNIHSPAVFHVFNKELVEPPIVSDAVYDPPDADHTYNVKVMLMASLSPEEFFDKTLLLTENGSRDALIHPTRAIQFLVGLRSKNETMAIGGPWSPSLDGPNPEKDPSVLIKTAIRACRSLTGIDLSQCTQWYKFLEIHYRRLESSSRPARTETTVIFLPDVWSVMPTRNEFEELQTLYADTLNAKINPDFKKSQSDNEEEKPPAVDPKVVETTTAAASGAPNKPNNEDSDEMEVTAPEETAEEAGEKDKSTGEKDKSTVEKDKSTGEKDNSTGEKDKSTEEKPAGEVEEEVQTPPPTVDNKEPASWKDLDPKTMKVNDLRAELNARGLSTKGLKSQLVARLTKELKQEQDKDENKEEEAAAEEESVEILENKTEEAQRTVKEEPEVMEVERSTAVHPPVIKKKEAVKLDEKQKTALTNAYKLPSQRCIPVHPHPKAKSGKFDCTVMSLSVLLDYRTEDNKEGTFEVSLFAELFNEMLMRDAAFKIYKVLMEAVSKKQQGPNKTESSSEAAASTPEAGGEESSKKKVIDREALAAFSYFDQGHCGYLEVKELEDIFYILNIDISRSQIKKLISKVLTSKDQLNYRSLIEGEEATAAAESPDQVDEEKEKKMAMGFRAFINGRAFAADDECQEEGVCAYKGKVVDVGKLLSQLARSEKALLDTEATLNTTTKSLDELQHASEKFNAQRDKLTTEVRDLKKKVRTAEEELKKSQSSSISYVATLKDIYYKVGPLVNTPAPPIKEEGGTKEDENSTTNGSSAKTTAAAAEPGGKNDK